MQTWTLNYDVDGKHVRPRNAYLLDEHGTRVPLIQERIDRHSRIMRLVLDGKTVQQYVRRALESGKHAGHYPIKTWEQRIGPSVLHGLMAFHAVHHPSAAPLWAWNRGQAALRDLAFQTVIPLLELNDPCLTHALPHRIGQGGDVHPTVQGWPRSHHNHFYDNRLPHDPGRSAHRRLRTVASVGNIDIQAALAHWLLQAPSITLHPRAWTPPVLPITAIGPHLSQVIPSGDLS